MFSFSSKMQEKVIILFANISFESFYLRLSLVCPKNIATVHITVYCHCNFSMVLTTVQCHVQTAKRIIARTGLSTTIRENSLYNNNHRAFLVDDFLQRIFIFALLFFQQKTLLLESHIQDIPAFYALHYQTKRSEPFLSFLAFCNSAYVTYLV